MEPKELPKPYLSERSQIKEKSWVTKLATSVLDTFRDIHTASEMAKSKFDGDSALMHVARGVVSGAVGAGLEVATDELWKKAWQGKAPIFERFQFDPSVGQKLERFANEHPRWQSLFKEGTQDLALGALYNFMAFRSQPMLPQAESDDLLRALAIDAGWAAFGTKLRGVGDAGLVGSSKRTLTTIANFSNPVTQLGAKMIINGTSELVHNFKIVRSLRKEKGGLEGKSVPTQKQDKVYYGKSRWNKQKEEVYDLKLDS